MVKYLGIITFMLVFVQSIFSQGISGSHSIKPSGEPNEYIIKTTIKGLEGVDIARIKYVITNKHTYKASPKNAFFSDRNEQYIKFYIMGVPATGELNIELGIILSDATDYTFPVEFQYSKNEEKKVINLPKLVFEKTEIVATIEEPILIEEEVLTVVSEIVDEVEKEEDVVVAKPELIAEEATGNTVEEELEPIVISEEIEEIEVPEPILEKELTEENIGKTKLLEVKKDPVVEKVEEIIVEPTVDEPLEVIEEVKKVVTLSEPTAKYTVQLLSLSQFSQARLNAYCKKHNLSINDVIKNKVGATMKITYGKATSIEEARTIKKRLLHENDISGFVTKIR